MTPEGFARRPLRRRFEAFGLNALAPSMERGFGEIKAKALGSLDGTIVELGPGTGVNMQHYPAGVRVIAYEPNPAMYEHLNRAADEAGVKLVIRSAAAERLEEETASVDAVVGTLVLCGVDNVHAVLSEVRRVLRPGGKYFFIEHVVAPEGSWTRRLQRVFKHPHRWLMNGCEVDRDTTAAIQRAGFASVNVTVLEDAGLGYVKPMIIGTAIA